MTRSLQARTAVVLFIGILLIPVWTSSLRGLTHVLSCEGPVAAGFDVAVPEPGEDPEPVLLEPTAVTRGDASATTPAPTTTTTEPATTEPTATTVAPGPTLPAEPTEVCGGMTAQLRLTRPDSQRLLMQLQVANAGTEEWRGTVVLQVNQRRFPVDLGRVAPGDTRVRTIEVDLASDPERVSGQLYLGP